MSETGQGIGKSLRDALLLAFAAAVPLAGPLALLRPSFARPWGLALAGLAVPLVALHLLKPRRRRAVVGSVLLWKEVVLALDARHPWQRLRRNLPLFLELLALFALTVALAGPRFRAGPGAGRSLVIVLDASASMKTRDGPGGASRFEAARSEARALVAELHGGERALVLVATPRGARTAQGWTDDPKTADEALLGLACTDGPADLGDALVLAAAAARTLGEQGEVLVFTDGGGPPVPAIDFQGRLRHRPMGTESANVGIVGLELRAEDDEGPPPHRHAVLALVRNAGDAPRSTWIELRREGNVLDARKLEVAPRTRAAVRLEARLAPGPVSVRILPAPGDGGAGRALDLLPEDDEATAIVPSTDEVPVAVAGSRPDDPLERALRASARVRIERRPLDALEDPALRLVVVEGGAPPALPRANVLLVAPPAGRVGPVTVGEPVLVPRITGWDRDDRLLRFASFDDVEVVRARRLTLASGARALVTTDQGPLVATWNDGEHARVLVGCDLSETSWPLRLSFPVFVRNLVLAALEDDVLGPRGTVRAGSTVSLRASAGDGRFAVRGPWGRSSGGAVEEGRAVVADTDDAGTYVVRFEPSGQERLFAVATLDDAEAQVQPRVPLAVGGDTVVAVGSSEPGEREVEAPFLLLALVAFVLEGYAFHRRW